MRAKLVRHVLEIHPPQPLEAWPGHSEQDPEHPTHGQGRRGRRREPIVPSLLN